MDVFKKVTVLATALCGVFVFSQELAVDVVDGAEIVLPELTNAVQELVTEVETAAEAGVVSDLRFGVMSLAAALEEYHIRLLYRKELLEMQKQQLEESTPFEEEGAFFMQALKNADGRLQGNTPAMSQTEINRRREDFNKAQNDWKNFLDKYRAFLAEKQDAFAKAGREREQKSIASLRDKLVTYATQEGYDYILDNSTSPVLLIFPKRHNITSDVIAFLNAGHEEDVEKYRQEIKELLTEITRISASLREIGLPVAGDTEMNEFSE